MCSFFIFIFFNFILSILTQWNICQMRMQVCTIEISKSPMLSFPHTRIRFGWSSYALVFLTDLSLWDTYCNKSSLCEIAQGCGQDQTGGRNDICLMALQVFILFVYYLSYSYTQWKKREIALYITFCFKTLVLRQLERNRVAKTRQMYDKIGFHKNTNSTHLFWMVLWDVESPN